MNKVGIDLVNISRIEKLSEITKNKLFNSYELELASTYTSEKNKMAYLAGRFAVKEALSKALGVAFTKLKPSEIVVKNLDSGQPVLMLEGNSLKNYPNLKCEISISHDFPMAAAVVIVEDLDG